MAYALLTLVLLHTPAPVLASPAVVAPGRRAVPECCLPSHALRYRTPGAGRRRFRVGLEDDDERNAGRRARGAVLPPPGQLPSTLAPLPRAALARRPAAVPLVYALCTLRI